MSSLPLTASATRFVPALLVCCGCLLPWMICTQNMADAAHAPLSTVATLLDLSADRHQQLWTWSGIAVAVLLLVGAWITTLHRALKRQALAKASVCFQKMGVESRTPAAIEILAKRKAQRKVGPASSLPSFPAQRIAPEEHKQSPSSPPTSPKHTPPQSPQPPSPAPANSPPPPRPPAR